MVNQNKKAEDKNSKSLLRDAAESKLSTSLRKTPGLKTKPIDEIIHELEVHQIELEMQNSELKNTLVALEEAKDRHIDLYDFAPVGYLTISSKGVIVEANLTAATMLGVERSRLVTHGFALFIFLKDLTIWEHFLVDIFHNYEKHNCELLLNRQDSSTFNALFISTRLEPNDGTKLARIAISDITEHTKAVEELQESKDELQELFKSMINAFAIFESVFDDNSRFINCRFVYINNAYELIAGVKNDEVKGKTVHEVWPETEPEWIKKFGETATTGVPQTFEMYHAPTGKLYYCNVYRPGQTSKRFCFISEDITDRKQAEEEIKENLNKIKRTFEQTIATLGNLIEVQDPYTSGHQKRVAAISTAIAKNLGLSKETVEAIWTASLIHDIGKISVPATILSKPGKLTGIERAMIETHSQTGFDIVKEIDFPYPIAKMILQHHEKINGLGYPNGLKGDAIMLEAKIIAVADVFEAMTSHRPYRAALSLEAAMDELISNKGTLYDPDVVDSLTHYVDSYYKIELDDHICSIYSDFEVQISYIVPYMDIGLQKNHKCIYITDENSIESIISAFKIKGTNLSAYLEKGQFVFFTGSDTYLKDGHFDPGRMISIFKAEEKTALKEGYSGIRVTGEMTWILSKLPGTERFMEYENKFDEFFTGSKTTAICQYDENKFDKKILIEVIKAHPKVGINGLFYTNNFYKEHSAVSLNDELNGMDYKEIERKYHLLIEKIKK